MSLSRLVVSNFATGLELDRTPFLIDNDAFPELTDAYAWRGRVLRKRAANLLGRLEVTLTSQSLGTTDGSGNFSGNILTILGLTILASDASIVPGSVTVTVDTQNFVEPNPPDGTLSNGIGGTGTINYATGALTIITNPSLITTAITITFSYFPALPVMGLEDFDVGIINQPVLISFDTLYSYGLNQGTNTFYNVTFYKTTGLPFHFNGGNYQQFWTTNYLGITTINDTPVNTGCMWATNSNPGMHFQAISTIVVGAVTTINTLAPHNLVTNDWVWFNENSGADAQAILNGKSFQITKTGATSFTIALNSTGKVLANNGIFQSLTNSGIVTNQDGIRWFDGDPTGNLNFGWVNFAPPLSAYDSSTNPFPQYLVGAKTISAYKNRLVFSAVYITTSQVSPGIQYFPNRIVYSQVGTPFYTNPLPFTLTGQQPDTTAWYQNVPGKGGFLTAPIDQEIITVNTLEDILIYGMETKPLKLISTGVDSLPFVFQTVSAEYGSISTFSAVTLDQGVLYIGEYGIALISPTSGQRVDLKIPDNVFNIGKSNQGTFRVTAVRDYQKEFVYFTFVPADITNISIFPSQTLLYNYRDQTWAVFNESYTHYGTFRRTTNRTWSQLGDIYGTWSNWNDPWNFGNVAFFPSIVAGNQQGFVMEKGDGTNEGESQYISDTGGGMYRTQITSPDHCLNTGDYIQISGIINSNNVNDTVQQVIVVDRDKFLINDPITTPYLGGGTYKRLSLPFIQTKQFPINWKDGRGVRVGTQRFLLENTAAGQITLNVYTSQDDNDPANLPVENGYLVYSNIVLTSPEPDLYNPTSPYGLQQQQIWHRLSNSFSGDTVQFAFTLSDAQMRNLAINSSDIVLHAIVLDLYPGRTLA